ncbi:tape measure protein [Lachnoclostridium phytofermentans]|uniref:Phage tape measure protein n=1 Tax=Lachnoclostridium phytofermentans (strain ATCC 700394 / DSM 18823 / ISDg) TaxID=357809 RepID=A9KKK4_LACP7|nr:tape measure protein [Lachnoclostridium phytofermentans]ABX41175.1 phage tape measure protein [Lachnoclostridium phytofermentans ISDg]
MADISAFFNLSQKISDTVINQITNVYSKSISASVTHTVNKVIENSVVNVDRTINNIEKMDRSININIGRFRKFKEETQEPIKTESYGEAIEKIGMVVEAINKMGEVLQRIETQESIKTEKFDEAIEKIDKVDESINKMGESLQRIETQESIKTEKFDEAIEKIDKVDESINKMDESLQRIETQESIKTEKFDEAIEKIDKVDESINKMGESLQKAEMQEPIKTESFDEATEKISKTEEAINKIEEALQKTEVKSEGTGAKLKKSFSSIFSSVRDNLGNNFAAVGKGIGSVGNIINSVTSFGTKYLDKVENSKILKTADALAQTRTKLTAMTGSQAEADQFQQRIFDSAQNSRTSYESTANMVLGLSAKGSFSNKEQIVTFTELVNKNSVLGGASAEGTKGVQTAVTEAMVSGTLSGEGFNNVLENAYPIIENIAAYLNKPIEAVQKMGAQGEISGEFLANAMFASAQKTNEEFSKTPMTFEQLISSIKDKALMVFQPVLQKISELTQNQEFMNMIQNIMSGLTFVGDLALRIVGVLINAASAIVDNWSWIAPMILLIAVAFGIWKLSVLLSSFSIKELTASLLACPLVWIIGIIMAIIAVIKIVIDHINKVGDKTYTVAGVICGILGGVGAFVWNLFLGLGDFILSFVNLIANAFIGVANFFANVFKNPISSIIYLFQGMADGVLGILEGIANAIDFVFGSNFGGTVAGWRSGLKDMADAAVQKLAPDEKYEQKIDYLNLSMESFGLTRAEYSDWWDKGNEFGNKINDLFKGSTGDDKSFDDTWDGILKNTDKIAHNTELQPDDLSYLLELAERDAINRFTTAEVKIDMGGVYNTVSSKQNLDGIVEYLTDKLRDELNNTARACNA